MRKESARLRLSSTHPCVGKSEGGAAKTRFTSCGPVSQDESVGAGCAMVTTLEAGSGIKENQGRGIQIT